MTSARTSRPSSRRANMRSAFGRPPLTPERRCDSRSSCLRSAWFSWPPVESSWPHTSLRPVQVLKVSSGPSGSEVNGNFVLTSERSVFNRNDGREVIVLFQWDAVPGPHRLVAQWRSPDSATTSSSTVNYIAREQRFGAYWSLPLSSSMTLGTWSWNGTMATLVGPRKEASMKAHGHDTRAGCSI